MSIKKINNYLKKFSLLTPPNNIIKNKVVEIIKEKIGVDVPKNKIEVKNKKIYINTSTIIKNEIFIQKNSILKELQINIKNKKIEDII